MKKLLILIAIVGLLSACNSASANEIQGKYVREDGESKLCQEYFDFKDKDTFEVQTSKKVSGSISSGTYETVENKENEYKFNYDQGGSNIYTLEISDDGTLKATQSGHDSCNFVKEKE